MGRDSVSFLIVEDHPVVRRGLRDILADEYPGAVFGEAADSSSAMGAFERREWRVVLLDINIPGRGGLEVLQDIARLHPASRVLVVSAYPEEEFAVRAFEIGASGYLSKNQAAEELVAATTRLLAGGKYVTASLAEKLADAVSCGAHEEPLSPREVQVLRLVAEGKSLKQIAAELALSAKTVGTYRSRLAKKTGLSNNVELTRYAFRHGITR
jgi:DNA-binding NarL/FixJ family response regulator